jgi:alpha-1,2-mannosyltransferase
MALWKYYHAPQTVTYKFEAVEVPRLLNVTGLIPPPPPDATEDDMPRLDIRPLKEFGLRFCVGKEWYRFPGSYYVPEGVKIDFVKSEFDGMLPGHFAEVPNEIRSTEWFRPGTQVVPSGLNDLNKEDSSHYVRPSSA